MTLHALEIPDDPVQLPAWLERQIFWLDLAQLVVELSAVHGSSQAGPSLSEVLGDSRESVLQSGLRHLPPRVLGYLLMRPQLLLELQELILAEGSEYWDQIAPPSPVESARMSRGRVRLETFLEEQKAVERAKVRIPSAQQRTPMASSGDTEPGARMSRGAGTAWYRSSWVASLATAAAVLFGVFVYEKNFRPVPNVPVAQASSEWGWASAGAINDSLASGPYLASLADAAEQWFNERPDSPAGLARRIGEFRRGCSILILSDHAPLSDIDREWLKERCRVWAGKLDGHLTSLESGSDVAAVRQEADETIRSLMNALRARSENPAG